LPNYTSGREFKSHQSKLKRFQNNVQLPMRFTYYITEHSFAYKSQHKEEKGNEL